jgi:hypothetical protein
MRHLNVIRCFKVLVTTNCDTDTGINAGHLGYLNIIKLATVFDLA